MAASWFVEVEAQQQVEVLTPAPEVVEAAGVSAAVADDSSEEPEAAVVVVAASLSSAGPVDHWRPAADPGAQAPDSAADSEFPLAPGASSLPAAVASAPGG